MVFTRLVHYPLAGAETAWRRGGPYAMAQGHAARRLAIPPPAPYVAKELCRIENSETRRDVICFLTIAAAATGSNCLGIKRIKINMGSKTPGTHAKGKLAKEVLS